LGIELISGNSCEPNRPGQSDTAGGVKDRECAEEKRLHPVQPPCACRGLPQRMPRTTMTCPHNAPTRTSNKRRHQVRSAVLLKPGGRTAQILLAHKLSVARPRLAIGQASRITDLGTNKSDALGPFVHKPRRQGTGKRSRSEFSCRARSSS